MKNELYFTFKTFTHSTPVSILYFLTRTSTANGKVNIIPPMHQLLTVHTINTILQQKQLMKKYMWYFERWMICAVKLTHRHTQATGRLIPLLL